MYSPRQVLKQEPAGIVTALSLVNAALINQGVYSMTDSQLSAWYAAALGLLTLFYIRPATTSKDALQELSDATPPQVVNRIVTVTPAKKPAKKAK